MRFRIYRETVHIRFNMKVFEFSEVVGIVFIAELTDDAHSVGFLCLYKLAIKKVDKHVALAGLEQILAQFDDSAAAPVCSWFAIRDANRTRSKGRRNCDHTSPETKSTE